MKKYFLIIVFVAVAIVAAGVIVYLNSKKYHATRIIKLGGHHNISDLMSFDKGYVVSWSKALQAKQASFNYNGTLYATAGGKLFK